MEQGCRFWRVVVAALLVSTAFLGSCAGLGRVAELVTPTFTLEGVSQVRLAGIKISEDILTEGLDVFQMGRIALAATRQDLPLALTLDMRSENPLFNKVSAYLARIDWVLLIDERETISGSTAMHVELKPGQPEIIPMTFSLNLMDFFMDRNAPALTDLALRIASEPGHVPAGVGLQIIPTIDTPLGPIRYFKPILLDGIASTDDQ